MMRFGLIVFVTVLALCHAALADDAAPTSAVEKPIDFAKDVEPILRENCWKCHGASKQRGDLRLDEKSAAMKGGESFAPAIIPGQSADSPLIRFTRGQVDGMLMPPEGERKLSDEDIEVLRVWVDQGAVWPEAKAKEAEPAPHWSFQPLSKPKLPVSLRANASWTNNPIDTFVLARMDEARRQGLGDVTPSTEADRVTLIRRVTFDQIGLPPTPEEVAEFLADSRPDAFERLIDRLLASPHFGERWARHWLDVVRFAESDGFETNQPRPNAWPYRDYVIRSFNEDKSFERFLFEQIAGDTVGVDEATGFLVGGAYDRVKSPDPALTAQQRADELHDMVSTTGSALFGLTVGCARCHNHKFDPISQTDYYSMKAVFAGVQHGDRSLRPIDAERRQKSIESIQRELVLIDRELIQFEPLATVSKDTDGASTRRSSVRRQANVERFHPIKARFVKFVIEATTGSEPCIDELEVFTSSSDPAAIPQNVALAAVGTRVTSSSNLPGYEIHQLKFINDGRYGNSASWISNEPGRGWVQLEFAETVDIDRIVWSRDRPDSGQFQDRIPTNYRIEAGLTPASLQTIASSDDRRPFDPNATPAVSTAGLSQEQQRLVEQLVAKRTALTQEMQSLSATPVVYAGRFTAPEPTNRLHRGDPLQPKEATAPAGLAMIGSSWQLPFDAPESERRRALATWIIDGKHPLTARVMVNRLWQFHFGQGLVTTPSDFGRNGVAPSHPALLDWLASESRSGSSPKRLHRMMLGSATYRQSSDSRKSALQADAGNRFLWRYAPRRLEAESIRDAILAVTGSLDDRMYGVGFDLFEPNTNYVKVYNTKQVLGPAEWRRMVYQTKPRMQLDALFGQFDCPDAGQIAPKRTSSITALQALNLLNSRFIVDQTARFETKLKSEDSVDSTEQVKQAFLLAFQREPSDAELAGAVELIRANGLTAFCRALLNANEFLFVF